MDNDKITQVDKIFEQKFTINLDDEDDSNVSILHDPENFSKNLDSIKDIIFDFDYSIQNRVIAFSIWHDQPDNIILEITNKLTCMYLISGTKYIRDFFITIINTENIQDVIKIEFAKTLCSHDPSKENYDILQTTIEQIENSPIVILIDCIIILMNSSHHSHIEASLNYFIAIINNTSYDIHFRYRTILSLEHLLSPNIKPDQNHFSTKSFFYISETLIEFLQLEDNTSYYRILGCQALLSFYNKYHDYNTIKNTSNTDSNTTDSNTTDSNTTDSNTIDSNTIDSNTTDSEPIHDLDIIITMYENIENFDEKIKIRIDFIQHTLYTIMNDQELDPNVRADAADVLLNLGSEEFSQHAKNTIQELASIDGIVRNIYQDAQNTHNTMIEKSAMDILIKLDFIQLNLTFEKIISNTMQMIKSNNQLSEQDHKSIKVALNRINLDKQLYSEHSISLKGILLRVISYINTSEHKTELYNRYFEELIDMHDKCSSGFAFRLINILSGYTEHSIRISAADQIAGNFSGRFNAKIREVKDEDLKNELVIELASINSIKTIGDRPNFLKFFRDNVPIIREEMYEEFKEDMEESEFDLYFRRAIAKYEGHEDWI